MRTGTRSRRCRARPTTGPSAEVSICDACRCSPPANPNEGGHVLCRFRMEPWKQRDDDEPCPRSRAWRDCILVNQLPGVAVTPIAAREPA